jgi:hypothetical protein
MTALAVGVVAKMTALAVGVVAKMTALAVGVVAKMTALAVAGMYAGTSVLNPNLQMNKAEIKKKAYIQVSRCLAIEPAASLNAVPPSVTFSLLKETILLRAKFPQKYIQIHTNTYKSFHKNNRNEIFGDTH